MCLLWLWLQDMIDNGLVAILVKVAVLGLEEKHLGKTLHQMQPHLLKLVRILLLLLLMLKLLMLLWLLLMLKLPNISRKPYFK